ncbi:MAG: ribosomal-protein-alanine acetyltransferase [Myxococcota bacterium]
MRRITRATASDAAVVHALDRVAAHRPWSEGSLTSTLALSTTTAWLVFDGDQPSAYLVASVVHGEAEILTLGTHPAHRRQGCAAELLRHAADHWGVVGVAQAFLEVRADNAGAIALYSMNGWVPAGTRSRYYSDGCDAVVMTWEP